MPQINEYAFETLLHIAHSAREAFLAAAIRPERDIEKYAGLLRAWDAARDEYGAPQGGEKAINASAVPLTVDEAFAATALNPEPLAHLTDAYITALYDFKGEPFNGAFRRAKETLGRSDMVDVGVLHAALGSEPDAKSGFHFNEASYR